MVELYIFKQCKVYWLMLHACLEFIDDFFYHICLTEDEDISKKLFLPVVLYGRKMLFQLDFHVQNFEYICPIFIT